MSYSNKVDANASPSPNFLLLLGVGQQRVEKSKNHSPKLGILSKALWYAKILAMVDKILSFIQISPAISCKVSELERISGFTEIYS